MQVPVQYLFTSATPLPVHVGSNLLSPKFLASPSPYASTMLHAASCLEPSRPVCRSEIARAVLFRSGIVSAYSKSYVLFFIGWVLEAYYVQILRVLFVPVQSRAVYTCLYHTLSRETKS
ncbi:hypothetical protein BB8028_0002g16360 [Beauveria bassiana]|uniref:Uncharacterized protein n=1 Tax=Beauveria bassiana TaxID=176275 RepID=A0A2S7Y556_BEABA|nr:hypothetical protein BB8028_0002g16360 [Beauveria bassiana]